MPAAQSEARKSFHFSDSSAFSEREEQLASEGRYAELHEELLQRSRNHASAVEGALIALRAAAVAMEGERPQWASEALTLATHMNPSCEQAWQLRLQRAMGAGQQRDAAECLERLGWLMIEPLERARLFVQASKEWRALGDDLEALEAEDPKDVKKREANAILAAVRSIPPARASGPLVRSLFCDEEELESLSDLLTFEFAGNEALSSEYLAAERHLRLGRLFAAEPNQRAKAVSHLLAAVESSDASGRVALEVLGGLHGLSESWIDIAGGLEAEARRLEETDPRAAAILLRRVVKACLEKPAALQKAEAALRRLVALEPEDVGSADLLLEILSASGRHRETVNVLVDLAEIASPATAALYLMRAGVIELGRFGERGTSLRYFDAALKRHPSCKSAGTHLKEAYREAGRWQDLARVLLMEVDGRAVDDRVLDTWREAGRILSDKAGDVVAATEVYSRIVQHDSTDDDAVRFFQDFHEKIGREASQVQALEDAAGAAESLSERIESLVRAAEAAMRLGSLPRARAILEEARAHAPDDVKLLERLVSLLEEHGDYLEAVKVLEAEAARLGVDNPHWPRIVARLSTLLLGPLGEVAAARGYLERLAMCRGPQAEEARDLLNTLDRDLAEAQVVIPFKSSKPEPEDDADTARDDVLLPAREALERGDMEASLRLASSLAVRYPLLSPLGLEAREFVADLLIDHFRDLDEGLDRLGEIGSDRALPVRVRRRVNEARLRILARDVPPAPHRDQALTEALLDAAAVAETKERAYEYRYRAARILCERKDTWRRGCHLLRGMLLDDESSAPVLEMLAQIFEREEQWAQLVEILWKLAEISSNEQSVDLFARLADIAFDRLEDPGMAVRAMRRSLERSPCHQPSLLALTRYASAAEDLDAMIDALRGQVAVAEDHSSLPSLHEALGTALEGAERHSEAVTVYSRLTNLEPSSLDSWRLLERAAEAVGDMEVVARSIVGRAQAVKDRVERASLLTRAARVHLDELGDRVGAERLVESALALEPSDMNALNLLRSLAERGGASPEQVVTLIRGAAEAASDQERKAELWCEAASLYAGRLEHEQAARLAYSRALEAQEAYPPALAGLGRLLLQAGDFEAAAAILQRLRGHEDAPMAARAWALGRLAEIALSSGKESLALQHLDEALALDPDDSWAHVTRGRLALAQGRFADAVASLSRAVSMSEAGAVDAPSGSELTEVFAALGAAFDGLGRSRDAALAWGKALARDAVHEGAMSALARIAAEEADWETMALMRERAALLLPEQRTRAAALADVGVILRDQAEDPRRALETFRRAASLDPESLGIQASLLALARMLGFNVEASQAAFECARLAPNARGAADYLALAGECARAEGDREEALELFRASLERHPACEAALEGAVDLLEAMGARREAADMMARALVHAGDQEQRRRLTVARARLLEDLGDETAAAACLARAVVEAPNDGPLLLALAGSTAAPEEDARAALSSLVLGLQRHPLEVPRLLATATISAHLGELDRSYLCGALLSLMRADTSEAGARAASLRDCLPGSFSGVLSDSVILELLPEALTTGEAFFRAAEATILTTHPDRRPFNWSAPETRTPSSSWVGELKEVARALRLPMVQELRCGPEGCGVMPLPDRGRLVVAEDLLEGQSEGERRFALAFGLVLSVPGRRWVAAPGSPQTIMNMLLTWARGEADPDTALAFGERLGPGRYPLLAMHAVSEVSAANAFMEAAVVAATRFGLVASGDLLQGMTAAMHLLCPGRSLPREPGSLAALGRLHSALGDMVSFAHSSSFLRARQAIGAGVPRSGGD